MEYKILDKINSPEDLKALSEKEIPLLLTEIRSFLVDTLSRTGGHLASNLGVAELSVALHRVFDSPRDHIIFDVGHQSYVHKILTGRREEFDTLRTPGGLSGFTKMDESCHDAFGAGHSSTSVSAALGYAESDKLSKTDAYTVAVLGDGSYTGGMVHEALNNASSDLKLIIILNENGMSISVNKGRFASYLSKVRMSKGYISWKRGTKSFLGRLSFIGRATTRFLGFFKRKIKNSVFSSNYFEDLGLYYIGPVDGNDYKKLTTALKEAKRLSKCVVVHIKTRKGYGYTPAEKEPEEFHSITNSEEKKDTFHSVFAEEIISHAAGDERIIGITAAMGQGTGLSLFGEKFPERYFDVGIAEEHALTFSAGLAANKYKPYMAIYSTFLQRAYDSVVHDICLQNLPVRIMIDRASLSVGDGATHHGIFDVAFLSHVPNMTLLSPISFTALRNAISYSLSVDSPIAIRYPNRCEDERVARIFYSDENYKDVGLRISYKEESVPDYVFVTYGSLISEVLCAAEDLKEKGYSVGVVLLEILKPYEKTVDMLLPYIKGAKRVLFAEEGIKNGGAGMIIGDILSSRGFDRSVYDIAAIDDNFAIPKEKVNLYEYLGIGRKALGERILTK